MHSRLYFVHQVILFSSLAFYRFAALGQPCGPEVHVFERQLLTPQGDILLLNSWLGGELMMGGEEKGITMNYTLISHTGTLKKDTSIYLNWPDYYYNFFDCIATYDDWSPEDELYDHGLASSEPADCMNYQFYSCEKQLILGCFLTGDRKYAFDLAFDEKGRVQYQVTDIDSVGDLKNEILDDSTKRLVWRDFLSQKYGPLMNMDMPKHSRNGIGDYQFKGFNLERIQPLRAVNSKDSGRQDRWQVNGKGWQIALEGYIVHMYNPPLVSLNKSLLYITVFNDDNESCPGYGYDIYPILYCIDLKKGKICWKYDFRKQ